MRYVWRLSCLMLMLVMAGCVMDRVVWSPDGSMAAVLADDGWHMCDLSGKLSPVFVPNVKCVQWLPDSKRLVVCSQRGFNTWDEASQALSDDAKVAAQNAEAVRAELLAAPGDWSAFFVAASSKLHLTHQQIALAILYLRDHAAENHLQLKPSLAKPFAEQALVEDLVQIYQVDAKSATAGAVLYRAANAGNGIKSVRVSHDGKAVLLSNDLSIPKDHAEPLELLVVPTDGSKDIRDLGRAAAYPDWTPDGKFVVFIRPANWTPDQKEVFAGILARQQVADGNGRLLDRFPMPEDLAGMMFGQLARVRVAGDGRIFFNAVEISLPAAAKDIDTQTSLFCFNPGKESTLTRVIPRSAMQSMGDAAQYFALSPDARYISVPFDDGRVSVLDIASGDAQIVQPVADPERKDRKRLESAPTWRNATELTFVRPIANSTAHEVVLYSVPRKSATVLSTDWPAGLGSWLAPEPPKSESPAPADK